MIATDSLRVCWKGMTAEAAPSPPRSTFWRALFRWDAGKIVLPVAVRNSAGFAIAFIIAALVDGVNAGVLASLGALNVSYSDGLDPYGLRGRRMALASVLCGLAVTAGALSGHTNATAVITAALGAFAAGMLIALGARAGDLGVVILVTLIVFAARPLPPRQAIESGLAACAGGLLQALLSIASWPVTPYGPERKIIAELYRAIANIAKGEPAPSSAPPVSRQITDAQEALAALAHDHGVEAERHVFLLNQAERIRLSLIALNNLRGFIARQAGAEAESAALGELLVAAGNAAEDIGACALSSKPAGSLAAFEAAADGFRKLQNPVDAALHSDAVHEVDALGGRIRAAASVSSGLLRAEPELLAGPSAQPATWGGVVRGGRNDPWYLRYPGRLAKLWANLSLESTVFRHALRLAVCLAIGDSLGRAISLQRTYWIPMTIAIVLKPDFSSTFTRGILRIAGTLAGLALATALFHYLHTGPATDIALMTVFMFLLRWVGPANYGIFVAALSSLVVLLIATTGVSPHVVIAARAENTLIGGALALLAYAVWPTWEKTQVGSAIAEMIDRYTDYFDAVITAFSVGGATEAIARALGPARLASRLARSNAEASVDRIAAEPGTTREQIAALAAIMASSHAFVHAVMTMESGIYHTEPVPIRAATREFAIKMTDALHTMSSWLRGQNVPAGVNLPDLRAAQTGILRAPVTPSERYTLIDRETDRATVSVNTLAEQVARWLELSGRRGRSVHHVET